nr:MAG TPA: hypothetical protein [Caudoviricetes sp.]DAT07026.1 MAG TPA: hypothetical protein [Caudoviricetes sp.]
MNIFIPTFFCRRIVNCCLVAPQPCLKYSKRVAVCQHFL